MSETKICSKCGVEKTLPSFVKHKQCVGGYSGCCKTCDNHRQRQLRMSAPEKYREQNKAYRESNRERIRKQKRQWAQANKVRLRKMLNARRKSNPLKHRQDTLAWYYKHKEKVNRKRSEDRKQNPAKHRVYEKRHRQKNHERILLSSVRYNARKSMTGLNADPALIEAKVLIYQIRKEIQNQTAPA